MARPTTISDDQILDAARAVFLEHGVSATTAEVAKRAGVAEGSIFKRWKTKQDLFHAALSLDNPDVRFLADLEATVGKGALCDTLAELATNGIEFFRKMLPLMMMSWSNPTQRGLPAHLDRPNSKPIVALKRLAGYFEAEMRLGRMARRDPEVLARTFMGAIQHYAFLDLLDRNRAELPMPAPMFVRGLVHLIWNGVAPDEGAPNAKRTPRPMGAKEGRPAPAGTPRPMGAKEGRPAPAGTPRPMGAKEGRPAPAGTPRPMGAKEGRPAPAGTPRPMGAKEGRPAPAGTPRPMGAKEGRKDAR